MAKYPALRSVVRWHDYLIGRYGGHLGVRDPGLLASALAAPRQVAAFETRDVLPQAAALCYSLVNNHAFIDGNKRTAFLTMDVFLRRNGYVMRFDSRWVDVIEAVATHSVSRVQLADLLRGTPHARR